MLIDITELMAKTIKGLECREVPNPDTCKDCPYFSEDLTDEDYEFVYNCNMGQIENDALTLLKERQPMEPQMDYDGRDVWRCGCCGATLFHPSNTQADEDEKNYRKYCFHCGRNVKW